MSRLPLKPTVRSVVATSALAILAACGSPPPGAEYYDPHEEHNRAVHADNVAIDRMLFGGPGEDKKVLPQPVADGLANIEDNLDMPRAAVNSVLQGRLAPAVENTARFAVNSTIGVLGIFDPASKMGLEGRDTDFGETLYVWGAPEGAFLMLPIAGPTTERDLAGTFVDMWIDPLDLFFHAPETYYITAASLGGKVAKRQRYGDAVDAVLYDSADSYAQVRLLYLQNRHYELGIEADVIDPYEDPYAQ